MKKFYITGVSGTGKTAISKVLNERNIYSFDIDAIPDLCHWVNKESGKQADWSPGICNPEMLQDLLKKQTQDVVVVGVASNQDDYLDLFDEVFLLQSSEETFLDRIRRREDNEFGKDSAEQEIILSYYKDFEKSLLNKGVISVNTEDSISDAIEKITSYL